MSVKNKSIIITGASRGIGAACARHLAEQGGQVVLAARTGEDIERIADELSQQGHRAVAKICDVSIHDDVADLADFCLKSFGSIDVLVNNAGIIDPIARLDQSDPQAWSHAIDINIKGVYYALRSVLPQMVRQGGGTIINMSSGAATGALEGWSHYCASKAAVLALTRCVHKEYGDKNIRALGLSPGTVATDMMRTIQASGINPVSQLAFDTHIPPVWVAKAIAYLCGPESNGYLGTDFSIKTNEGRTAVGLPPIGET